MDINNKTIILFIVGLLSLLFLVPLIFAPSQSYNEEEFFKTANIPMDSHNKLYTTHHHTKHDKDSVIFDPQTGSVMTGNEFMSATGIITPQYVTPAWENDVTSPVSGGLTPDSLKKYENDPRLVYNKCSLSCCSNQYPTPHKGEVDPFVCDKNGKNKYLSSNYTCTNNVGGTGCLCLTKHQVNDGFSKGWVDYDA